MTTLGLAAGIFFGLVPINITLIGILIELTKINENKNR